MLEIFVADKFKLDLPNNIAMQFTEENPYFTDEGTPIPYTLSLNIDATRNNLIAMGLLNRVTSRLVSLHYPARVMYNSKPYSVGEILLLGYDNKIKIQYKGFAETIEYDIMMNKLNLDRYDLGEFPPVVPNHATAWQQGGSWFYYGESYFDQYKQFMLDVLYNQDEFAIGPVKMPWEWEGTGYTRGIYNLYKSYKNFINPSNTSFEFNFNYYQNANKIHTPIYPFPYVYKVLNKVFGSRLLNNPFEEGDLRKVCIIATGNNFNNKNVEYVRSYMGFDKDKIEQEFIQPIVDSYAIIRNDGIFDLASLSFSLQNFFPKDYSFAKFLVEFLKLFGMYITKKGNNYIIMNDVALHQAEPVIRLDDYLIDYEIIYEEQEPTEYVLQFGSNSPGESQADYGVNYVVAAANVMINSSLPKIKNSFLNFSNTQVFELERTVRGLTNQEWLKHETVKSALIQKENPEIEEKKIISTEVYPLEMQIEQYWTDNDGGNDLIQRRHWEVGTFENFGGKVPVMLSYGWVNAGIDSGDTYPLITNHNKSPLGNRLGDISLLPNGEDGLIKKFHSWHKKFWENTKIGVRAICILPFEINKVLNITDKVNLKGKDFFIKSREFDLTHDGISPVEFYLVECKS